jgi:dihydropteroate synthase
MGVINITPNSFSDGNQHNSLESFSKRFNELLDWADIIDIGAESSAPMNQSISKDEELKRYQDVFFPFLEKTADPQSQISIDTYKVEVFKEVAHQLNQFWPKTKIIFNDVSGKLDSELLDLLNNFKIPFTYIYSHNLCKSRKDCLKHMDHVTKLHDFEFVKGVVEYFIAGIDKIKETDRPFMIDPCFGFSKTREQNHTLLKYFKTFLLQLPYSLPCVYGISKKSFLRFPKDLDVKDKENLAVLEQMQSILMYDLLKESLQREIIFRVHEPKSFQAANNIKKIFDL